MSSIRLVSVEHSEPMPLVSESAGEALRLAPNNCWRLCSCIPLAVDTGLPANIPLSGELTVLTGLPVKGRGSPTAPGEEAPSLIRYNNTPSVLWHINQSHHSLELCISCRRMNHLWSFPSKYIPSKRIYLWTGWEAWYKGRLNSQNVFISKVISPTILKRFNDWC